jgi:SAM-dependent methyltransferase
LNRLFLVLADGHRESETLATLFAKIFVNRHMGRSGLVNQKYMHAGRFRKNNLPVAGHDWQLRLYDPYVKLVGRGGRKKNVPRSGNYPASFRILDIGCGTGTLALLMKKLRRAVDIVGRDPDPRALTRAKRRAERAGIIDPASKAPFYVNLGQLRDNHPTSNNIPR